MFNNINNNLKASKISEKLNVEIKKEESFVKSSISILILRPNIDYCNKIVDKLKKELIDINVNIMEDFFEDIENLDIAFKKLCKKLYEGSYLIFIAYAPKCSFKHTGFITELVILCEDKEMKNRLRLFREKYCIKLPHQVKSILTQYPIENEEMFLKYAKYVINTEIRLGIERIK